MLELVWRYQKPKAEWSGFVSLNRDWVGRVDCVMQIKLKHRFV